MIAMNGALMLAMGAETKTAKPPRVHKIRVLLVTGGHDFEHELFLDVFRSQPDLEVREVTQPEAQAWFARDKADQFDVMVWYDLWQEITEESRKNLVELLSRGKPLVALHHSIATYQKWPGSIELIGGKFRIKGTETQPAAVARHGRKMNVKIEDHPITRFMKDFVLEDDEAYKGMDFLPGIRPLLTTDHPENDKLLGWVHMYGKNPVVYLQPGHGPSTYKDPNFRRLVAQAIRWVAGQLPDPSEDGFVSLFNGKDLAGWHVMGKPQGFEVKDGVIRSESGRGGFWLRSDKTYCDFIIRLDWRVSKEGNSGVFFRSQLEGVPWEPGHEAQISHQRRDAMICTGALYDRVAADPRPDESAEVWHSYEIQCRGPNIRVFLDQVPVIDVDQRAVPVMKDFPLCGYVGLQDSHNDTGWIEFRNIRIKELKSEGHDPKKRSD
ncbi:MAG TPA: family 16 glycoside hydrolase [Phycisphaerae bacterium]|nr:family 16 glycoside hydrolase [Phycisphaerae bacterium]